MEELGARALLGLFCFVNLLIMYGAHAHLYVGKRIWNAIFVFQTVFVTGYIIADNVANPLQGGYITAVFGYIFVYRLIFCAWASWLPNTLLEPDMVYIMKPEGMIVYGGDYYISGTVMTGTAKVTVLLKNKPPRPLPQQTIAVKLLYISNGNIFVAPA